jgi:hypothetical protein
MNRWLLGAGVLLGVLIGGALGFLELRSDRSAAADSRTKEVDTQGHGVDGAGNRALAPGPGTRVVRVESAYPGTDPTREDYDAFKAGLLGLDSEDIFAREPRLPEWAEPMEERIHQVLGSDFDVLFGGQIRHAECRSSSCRVAIEVEKEHKDRAFRFLQIVPFGNRTTPDFGVGEDGTVLVRAYIILSRDNRELSDHEAWYREMRRKRLEMNVEGGLMSPEEVAALESGQLP